MVSKWIQEYGFLRGGTPANSHMKVKKCGTRYGGEQKGPGNNPFGAPVPLSAPSGQSLGSQMGGSKNQGHLILG